MQKDNVRNHFHHLPQKMKGAIPLIVKRICGFFDFSYFISITNYYHSVPKNVSLCAQLDYNICIASTYCKSVSVYGYFLHQVSALDPH